MRTKFIIVVLASLVASLAFQPWARVSENVTKIDPAFNSIDRLVSANPDISAAEISLKTVGGTSVKIQDGKILVSSLIKTSDVEKTVELVESLGGIVIEKLKTIITVRIPLDAVKAIAAAEETVYISAAKKMKLKMDVARNNDISMVKWVQAGDGAGLDRAYNGNGVIIGVYDTGIDCAHPDFTGRIYAYKDMATGQTCDKATIDAGTCTICTGTDTRSSGHGTHVSGIAAGSGAGTNFIGVAPQSELVVVSYEDFSDAEALSAFTYIFGIGQTLQKPVVINNSWGGEEGAHDGTSTLEQGIDELLTGYVGRVMTFAAGNETAMSSDPDTALLGIGGLHATISVAAGESRAFEEIIPSYPGTPFADIWLEQGGTCKIGINMYDLADVGKTAGSRLAFLDAVAAGGSDSKATGLGVTLAVDFTDNNNAQNNKQHAQAAPIGASSVDYAFDLVFEGGASGCAGNAWLPQGEPSENAFSKDRVTVPVNPDYGYIYVNGDNNSSVNIPSTANMALSIASFSARDPWVDMNSNTWDQSVWETLPNCGSGCGTGTTALDISVFSSLGPGNGASNTARPDIAAPGEPIISAKSSAVSQPDTLIPLESAQFIKMEGTSMASPFVAGVVPLMMERDNCLTVDMARAALKNNATPVPGGDIYTWGAGKVNALASVLAITPTSCVVPGPTPASGGGGCSLIRR